jgi:hypothetical protein
MARVTEGPGCEEKGAAEYHTQKEHGGKGRLDWRAVASMVPWSINQLQIPRSGRGSHWDVQQNVAAGRTQSAGNGSDGLG